MSNLAFDTLDYAQKLRDAGFTQQQAETQARALASIVDEKLATKHDLVDLEQRLIIKLGSMMCVAIAVVATLVKIL